MPNNITSRRLKFLFDIMGLQKSALEGCDDHMSRFIHSANVYPVSTLCGYCSQCVECINEQEGRRIFAFME